MKSWIFSNEITNGFAFNLKSLFLILVFAADAASVNPNGINILLANGITALQLIENQYFKMVQLYKEMALIEWF